MKDVNFFNQIPDVPNQQIILPVLSEKQIELWIKREDVIHPFVSGNKFRKLKYNVKQAKNENKIAVLTFGGAFSNHILAAAIAAQKLGIPSVGIIRGNELANNLENVLKTNATLNKAHQFGMQFEFVSREEYRKKNESLFINRLKEKFGDFYLIPEGGTNMLAVKGCEEILKSSDVYFDRIACAVGTGGTIAGIINASDNNQKVMGFPALKGNFLNEEIRKFTRKSNWQLVTNYHFGGYAKYTSELINFLNNFTKATQIPLDPIYTGKMMYAILDLVERDYFSPGTKILAIHTGGLQGIHGFNEKLKKKNHQIINVV